MKILITGGCGFLGAHLVEHFLKLGHEIVVLDRLSYASAGYDRLRDISCFDDKRVRILGADLYQPIQPGMKQEIGKVDLIVHAAAESHVDRSIEDPMPFIQSNVIGVHHILMLAKDLGCRIFMVSTDEVYGPKEIGGPAFDADAPFRPGNPYAAAKAGGECLAMAYANTYGVRATIVNGMNFIGERQHPEKFVVSTIRKVLKGEVVTIHSDPARERSGTRFYLHCRNFASALEFIDHRQIVDPDLVPQKVHVVGEREISNLDMAQMIAGFAGKRLVYELVDFHSSRPGHDLAYGLKDNWLRANGWTLPLSLAETLEKTVRWYLDPKNDRWLWWGEGGAT
ncbi:MAG: dTDP-glucose 4,6-dehydratase [Terriglobales bacterium]